ncbi:MAG: DUF2071 domain-containing protein [Saprospiraceae bacterium]|nr:DUF2071 domain-containing protein [Saprospiraceae bacterium]
MSFLKAEWRRLLMANYEIDPQILQKYLPYKTELDLWQGTCYVSLVGFMFVNTRMLGIKVPYHTNFEEVNLRFYVRFKAEDEWRRGVVFIKEIVPRTAITLVANTLYKEHYETRPMDHEWFLLNDRQVVSYSWKVGRAKQSMRAEVSLQSTPIEEGSEAEFITEHYWGYTKVNDQKTFEYGVTHPKWEQYQVSDYEQVVDFELNYGADFACLNGVRPLSVLLAEGSAITVEGKRAIS